ncbi:hypothetical protein JXX06_09620 [Streptococcus suis]|uniref:hypothetical protein n=1 Tax=Streptococcus suis TaxID=1307 RepID=UPI0005CD4FE4|nr:hypothetical protein [Streptococcus suis]MCB2888067.1 hypothetical protein [Streptococcus suis]NQH49759.1 hypothetical protein [Streptococcus suis]NQI07449.1 hypothetical protein [Streptococcus suis]NQN39368.1 hypothetical protein [Streptococcus suis]NQN41232.1 hypothetical protein [Streptococcus suis]
MTTSKKIGRPTTDPKNQSKRIRMTETEVAMLDYCVKVTGKTQTDILMMGLEKVYQDIKK